MVLLASRLAPTELGLESTHARVVVDHLIRIAVADLDGPVDVVEGVRRHARVAVLVAAALAGSLSELGAFADADGAATVYAALETVLVVGARHGPVGALPEGLAARDGLSRCFLALGVDVVEDFLIVVLVAAVEAVELEATIAS